MLDIENFSDKEISSALRTALIELGMGRRCINSCRIRLAESPEQYRVGLCEGSPHEFSAVGRRVENCSERVTSPAPQDIPSLHEEPPSGRLNAKGDQP